MPGSIPRISRTSLWKAWKAVRKELKNSSVRDVVDSYRGIARAKLYRGVMDLIVPGVLEDFDIPDVVRALTPRPVWIVDSRAPDGTRTWQVGARERSEGSPFEQVCRDRLAQ